MNHSNAFSLSFPEAKTIIVSGDIHGNFNQLVFKLCIQYKLTATRTPLHVTSPDFVATKVSTIIRYTSKMQDNM